MNTGKHSQNNHKTYPFRNLTDLQRALGPREFKDLIRKQIPAHEVISTGLLILSCIFLLVLSTTSILISGFKSLEQLLSTDSTSKLTDTASNVSAATTVQNHINAYLPMLLCMMVITSITTDLLQPSSKILKRLKPITRLFAGKTKDPANTPYTGQKHGRDVFVFHQGQDNGALAQSNSKADKMVVD